MFPIITVSCIEEISGCIMKFTKMHGCGNDYVYVNCLEQNISDRANLSLKISDRHFGVGSDGLICIDVSEIADFKMDMYNSDGSQGKMCGNGIRCVGKFVYDYGLTDKTVITVETLGGIKTLYLHVNDGTVDSVSVCMGQPIFQPSVIPVLADGEIFLSQSIEINGKSWDVNCVSFGNPHAVTFAEDVDALDLTEIGPMLESHPLFPEKVNVEFVQVINDDQLKMRVWERGSGETLACGTGACASLVISALLKKTNNKAVVQVRGGELEIEWDRDANLVYMTGPASIVFEGETKEPFLEF